jgi:hypothetical protein
LNQLKNNRGALAASLGPEDMKLLEGTKKIMSRSNVLAKILPFNKWGVGSSQIAKALMSTTPGQNLLLGLADAPEGSATYNKLMNSIPAILGSNSNKLKELLQGNNGTTQENQ